MASTSTKERDGERYLVAKKSPRNSFPWGQGHTFPNLCIRKLGIHSSGAEAQNITSYGDVCERASQTHTRDSRDKDTVWLEFFCKTWDTLKAVSAIICVS